MSQATPLTTFQQRYIFPFLAVLVIIASIFVWLILQQQADLLDAELQKKGSSIVSELSEQSNVGILLKDIEGLQGVVYSTVTSDNDVATAALYNPEGQLLVSSDSTFQVGKFSVQEESIRDLGKSWLMIHPTRDRNDTLIGVSIIELSRERVLTMMEESAAKLITTTLIITLIIAIIVYWLLNKIKSLAEIEIERAREIEVAYRKLQELQGILKRTNETLEERVKERTIELERINIELSHVNTELKDFAYVVSHDLKAPLRAIASLTDWIIEDYNEAFDEDGKEQMALLKSRVGRMYKLLEGILRYSRIGTGQEHLETVELNDLVAEVIDTLLPSENFEITIENELPEVYCDRTKMSQVFQNLISNGIKYNNKSVGKIKVSSHTKEDGFHYFSITDNGKGIPKKDFDRVFKIFQTLEKNKESAESTGVGLTLVQKIVKKYGGDIMVDSVVGESTTFTFSLPVIEPEQVGAVSDR